jgi:hypothetical protein
MVLKITISICTLPHVTKTKTRHILREGEQAENLARRVVLFLFCSVLFCSDFVILIWKALGAIQYYPISGRPCLQCSRRDYDPRALRPTSLKLELHNFIHHPLPLKRQSIGALLAATLIMMRASCAFKLQALS